MNNYRIKICGLAKETFCIEIKMNHYQNTRESQILFALLTEGMLWRMCGQFLT